MNKILILIILCSILILILINKDNKDVFQDGNIYFLVLSYDTDASDKHLNNFIKMLEKNNFEYKITGNGEEWESWYGRSISYINYLKKLNPETYVLLCDARDVLINEPYPVFIEKALNLRRQNNNKIIIGTETGCCTGDNSGKYKAKNISEDI